MIVSSANKVISTGYNGPPASWAGSASTDGDCTSYCYRGLNGPTDQTATSYEDCPSLHAEMNALIYSDASARVGGTIYVTSDICYTCAKAIANSGLYNVVIVDPSSTHAHRDPKRSVDFLEWCGLKVTRDS